MVKWRKRQAPATTGCLTLGAQVGKWLKKITKGQVVLLAHCLSTGCAAHSHLQGIRLLDDHFYALQRLSHVGACYA